MEKKILMCLLVLVLVAISFAGCASHKHPELKDDEELNNITNQFNEGYIPKDVSTNGNISINLETIYDYYTLGNPIYINATIKNENSKSSVIVSRALDGSDLGWRYPHYSYTLLDPEGIEVPQEQIIRCGNMNPLRIDDFVVLEPGESYNVYNYSFLSRPSSYFNFNKSGHYYLRLNYSWISIDDQRCNGDGGFPTGDLYNISKMAIVGNYSSKWLRIKVFETLIFNLIQTKTITKGKEFSFNDYFNLKATNVWNQTISFYEPNKDCDGYDSPIFLSPQIKHGSDLCKPLDDLYCNYEGDSKLITLEPGESVVIFSSSKSILCERYNFKESGLYYVRFIYQISRYGPIMSPTMGFATPEIRLESNMISIDIN